MTDAEFETLSVGSHIYCIDGQTNPLEIWICLRKTSYGWQIKRVGMKKRGKAINARMWMKL